MPVMGRKIRILIVDDSSFMRMAIRGILSREPDFEVVGTAGDGVEGVEKATELQPDIITMDVEMPRLDGISALRQIMAKSPTRVLMVSTLTNEGAKATFEALEAGAIDYVAKNVTDSVDAQKAFREDLLRKVRAAFSSFSARRDIQRPVIPSVRPQTVRSRFAQKRIQCVAIGASTGGPVALQEVLSRIPVSFPYGIVVAIHMPKAFTGPYAERLNAKCSLAIREAVDGDLIKPGQVLIAPGGRHTMVNRQGGGLSVRSVPPSDHPEYIYIPSVDLLFKSMTDASNGALLGVILTGMGSDGFKGMQHLKGRGGVSLVQDEATSTIYGMPRACIEGGVADEILPLQEIGFEIGRLGS